MNVSRTYRESFLKNTVSPLVWRKLSGKLCSFQRAFGHVFNTPPPKNIIFQNYFCQCDTVLSEKAVLYYFRFLVILEKKGREISSADLLAE